MRGSFLAVDVTHKLSGKAAELADMMWETKVEEKFVWGDLEVMGCELQEKKQLPEKERRVIGIL